MGVGQGVAGKHQGTGGEVEGPGQNSDQISARHFDRDSVRSSLAKYTHRTAHTCTDSMMHECHNSLLARVSVVCALHACRIPSARGPFLKASHTYGFPPGKAVSKNRQTIIQLLLPYTPSTQKRKESDQQSVQGFVPAEACFATRTEYAIGQPW